jgi:hypothetical protein
MRNPIDFEPGCHFGNYLALRIIWRGGRLCPISPQRRTVGDLAVRPTVRVDRR